jgi:7,8-dihydroneopterin aldolase/epimerase/oxygenase
VRPDAVWVRGIEFEGNHGYTAAERRSTRRFRVDVTVELSITAAAASDRIADTVDYFKISELVVAVGTKSTFRLLEALAGAIGAEIQELYPRVAITIALEKLSPPCPGVPDASGVRISLPAAIS